MPTFAAKPNTNLNLMPYPSEVTLGLGALTINADFTAGLTGFVSPCLENALIRLNQRVEKQTGLFLKAPVQPQDKKPDLIIDVKNGSGSSVQTTEEDESYRLLVSVEQAQLSANSPYGALRGIETFLQLLENTRAGAQVPTVNIHDAPRFKWRGMLLDTVRHFIPIDVIKRQLDGMAAAKYNVFHWHLTDDQGWRMESKTYPRLHESGSDGLYYSQAEIKHIVAYASNLGIRVVPEIDVPGHATAIAVAYPELMSAPGPYEIEREWGVFRPLLNPANQDVYVFVDSIIGEVTELFPDAYVHIGGDEVNPAQWLENPNILAFMERQGLNDDKQLHAYFNRRVEEILQKHQRKMIGWDETYHPDLPKTVVIQSWEGQDFLGDSVNDGFQGILSTGFYLDQPQPTSYHYRNDPMPKPLQVDDKIVEGEFWQTWSFEMPRKKGGPLTGSFTLITAIDGKRRGYMDFTGKSRRAVSDIQTVKGVTSFWMDSWMGKTKPNVTLAQGKLSGYTLVANGQYLMSGELIAGSELPGSSAPQGRTPSYVTPAQEHLLLGAEAAIWAENLSADLLDLRMWPRSFAIAERLWSSAELTDESSMYQRLEAVGNWSTVSVGLQHDLNAYVALLRLANGKDVGPLQILAQAVEQAQYYHRHHEKFAADNYHQFEPLNRFADALPVESKQVRQLESDIQSWLDKPADTQAKAKVYNLLFSWVSNASGLMEILNNNHLLTAVIPVAKDVHDVSQLGLQLMETIESGNKLTAEQVNDAKALLSKAQQFQDELVVSGAYPIEKLLTAAY